MPPSSWLHFFLAVAAANSSVPSTWSLILQLNSRSVQAANLGLIFIVFQMRPWPWTSTRKTRARLTSPKWHPTCKFLVIFAQLLFLFWLFCYSQSQSRRIRRFCCRCRLYWPTKSTRLRGWGSSVCRQHVHFSSPESQRFNLQRRPHAEVSERTTSIAYYSL